MERDLDCPPDSNAVIGGNCSLTTEWMDIVEAAYFLRVSVPTLRNMTSNGQVPFYKLGRRNRFRKSELEELLLQTKRGKL